MKEIENIYVTASDLAWLRRITMVFVELKKNEEMEFLRIFNEVAPSLLNVHELEQERMPTFASLQGTLLNQQVELGSLLLTFVGCSDRDVIGVRIEAAPQESLIPAALLVQRLIEALPDNFFGFDSALSTTSMEKRRILEGLRQLS